MNSTAAKPRRQKKPVIVGEPATPNVVTAAGRTDMSNARRFVAQHGENVRWVDQWRKWLVWDGRRWEIDNRRLVEPLAKQTADALWHDVAHRLPRLDAGTGNELVRFARSTAAASGIANMLSLARSEPGIAVLPETLDAHPWFLNCKNCTVDLKIGQGLEHRREHYLTKICPHDFLPGAVGECPLWKLTVERIFGGNAGLIGFFRRLCGMAIVGDVLEHVLPIFHGKGSNGKTLVVERLLAALGDDYACKGTAELILAQRGERHSTDKTMLHGRRLVIVNETDEGRRLAEATVKELTGGDVITARRMREDNWSFRPSHTLILVTNHKPVVRGTDHGIWRRLRLVPFEKKFWDAGKGETGPEEYRADQRLKGKLDHEVAGIVRWLVEACLEWQREGLGQPPEVTVATESYRASENALARFVDECCTLAEGVTIKAADLIQSYGDWCKLNNEKPCSSRRLSDFLTEECGVIRRRSTGMWYSGITIQERF